VRARRFARVVPTLGVFFCVRLGCDSRMYLRYTTRKKDGKVHRYWRLVRSVRVGWRVIQQTVAHLGELDEHGRVQARALARHLIGEPQQAICVWTKRTIRLPATLLCEEIAIAITSVASARRARCLLHCR